MIKKIIQLDLPASVCNIPWRAIATEFQTLVAPHCSHCNDGGADDFVAVDKSSGVRTDSGQRERDRETGNDMYAMQRGLSPDEDHWRRLTDSVDSRNEK